MSLLDTLLRRTVDTTEVPDDTGTVPAHDTTPIADTAYRTRVRIAGRVRSMRIQPWGGVATLECTVVDDTAALTIVFLGRRHVAV